MGRSPFARVVFAEEPAHSLVDGWDYDAYSNAVVFYGASRPQPMDDIALSYQYFIKVCKNDDECDGE